MTKVFGIGFHKTGTTSLQAALEQLGYRVHGDLHVNDPDIAEKLPELAFQVAEDFDAFRDNPWPILYRELDEHFPGSKFILTTRDPEAWIASAVKHFGVRTTPMREHIYGVGCPAGNESIYLERFKRHYQEVPSYFRDRPDDLLVLELTDGAGWGPLCEFLGKPIPAEPFPHSGRGSTRWLRLLRERVVRLAGG